MRRIALFGTFATLSLVGQAAAATEEVELSLSDLMNLKVSVASKRSEDIRFAPGVISVITREQLESHHVTDLYQALQSLPGVIPDVGTMCAPILRMRGDAYSSSTSHELFLIDGIPMRAEMTSAPVLKQFPVASIERIEVIRGPGSVLYGANAFTGVISIVTRRDDTSGVAARIGTSYANKNNPQGSLDARFSKLLGSSPLRVHGTAQGALVEDNRRNDFDMASKSFHEIDAEEKGYGANFGVEWNGLSADVYTMRYDNHPYLMINGLDANLQPMLNTMYSLRWQHGLSDRVSLSAYVSRSDEQYLATDSTSLVASYPRTSGEVSVNYDADRFSLVSGVNYERVTGDAEAHANIRGRNTLPLTGYRSEIAGGRVMQLMPQSQASNRFLWYTQGNFLFAEKYNAIAGFQVNKVDDLDIDVVPRIGLVAKFSDMVYTKLLVAQAYRAAQGTEKFAYLQGDKDLKPEKTTTFDAQIGLAPCNWLNTSLTFFDQKQTDAINKRPMTLQDWNTKLAALYPSHTYSSRDVIWDNIGTIETRGLEWEFSAMPHRNIRLNGSVTSTWETYNDSISNASYVPDVIAKMGSDISLPAQFGLQLAGTWFSGYSKPYGIYQLYPGLVQSGGFQKEGAWLVDAHAVWDASKLVAANKGRYSIRLGVSNVFDQIRYTSWSQATQTDAFQANQGRRYDGSLKVEF